MSKMLTKYLIFGLFVSVTLSKDERLQSRFPSTSHSINAKSLQDVTLDVHCNFQDGDGDGGTEIALGNLAKNECIIACIMKRNNTDDSINGVTVYQGNKKGCWCEKGMRYRLTRTLYKSCFLKNMPVVKPNETCTFFVGDGLGGTWQWVDCQNVSDGIKGCLRRKKEEDSTVNGVGVYTHQTGCWCLMGMTYRSTKTKYKACFLKTKPEFSSVKCNLQNGIGKGGSEVWIGDLTKNECVDACIKRRNEKDDSINGVQVYSGDVKSCFCLKAMRYRYPDPSRKSCILNVPAVQPNETCNLFVGGGKGGDRIDAGHLTRSECVYTCLQRKEKEDDSINGVTVLADINSKGCWCEKAMTYRDHGEVNYVSCFLKGVLATRAKCGGTFRIPPRNITYPGHGVYKNFESCTWKVKAFVPIMIHFTKLELEPESKCNYDYVQINGGHRYCGFIAPKDVIGPLTGEITVKFVSDYNVEYGGFSIRLDFDACKSSSLNECDQICTKTSDSYVCSCNSGYKLGTDQHTCTDINECDEDNGGCSQHCSNTAGSYFCTCDPAYHLGKNNHTCEDNYYEVRVTPPPELVKEYDERRRRGL